MTRLWWLGSLFLVALLGCGDDDRPAPALDGGAAGPDGSTVTDGGGGGDSALPIGGPGRLEAVGASMSIGLSWDEVEGASSYRLYWSTTPGVTSADGTLIDDVTPGYIHRGLSDGVEHFYVVSAVGPGGETAPSPEASATPGGEYELVRIGTGVIDSVSVSGQRFVPIEDRVHVVLMAEGYLAGELGAFRDDVDDWHAETFAIDPYSLFTEAFVVWSLPRASAEHGSATDPQAADTAFRVPLTPDGRGVSSSVPETGPTSTRVWEALGSFRFPPTSFYPSSGRVSGIAKNVIPHILVLDPLSGRSGLSGRSRRLANPSSPSQRLSAAIAHGRAHEFSHAFARLIDEYLDDAHTANGEDVTRTDTSAFAANVVDDPSCGTLPWRHLLFGSAANPDVDELVGAFGNATSGYHSELRCLMNGTHDNAGTYGGDGRLRSGDRFCNYCRELMVFRLMERTHTLSDPDSSLSTWVADYRTAFYDRYGLLVPPEVPQRSSDGTSWFTPCVP